MLRELPITLDISKVGDQRTITGIRQYETDTVKFKISLVNGSIPFEINTLDNALIIMFGLKPDGKIIVNYAEINDNKIEYTLKEQDTTAAGVVKWQVCINESCIFATPQFSTTVDSAVIDNDELESNDSVEALFEAINSIDAFLANNNLVSKYSFMFDGHGRIFSYTWDTDISANSFAKYDNYNSKIAENHHVWLSSNVTNVQNGALGSVSKITKIICEAPQNRIALNEYSECDTLYGANSLSQFYILASLSSLLAEKTNTPISLSDFSDSLQELINNKLMRAISSATTVQSLNHIIYTYPQRIYTITLTGDAASYFDVLSGSYVEMTVIGNWETRMTRIIRIPDNPDLCWISYVEENNDELSFSTWEKIENNPVEYYESPETIIAINMLNNSTYVNPNKVISIVLTLSAAEHFGVDSGTVAELRTLKFISSNTTYYLRYLSFPNIAGLKWYQKITNPGIYGWVADNWTKADLVNGSVTLAKLNSDVYDTTPTVASNKLITSGAVYSGLYNKLSYDNLTTQTASTVFDVKTELGKIYYMNLNGKEYFFFTCGNVSGQIYAQFRFSSDGIEKRNYNNGSWGSWVSTLEDGSVTYNNLANALKNTIDGKLPFEQIQKFISGVPYSVDIAYLNTLTFNSRTMYYVRFAANALFTGSPREWCFFFEIESGCQIAIRPNGDIYYREYSNAQWSDFKIKAQDDYSNNAADYSLGFDSNGVVKASANVTGLTTGISGCNIVYTAPKCTTLTSAFKSVNPDLAEIYVDNYAEAMTIDSSILNDSNITIYYRGEFKLVDFLSNSQFRLNTRVTAVETLIGDIEDLIDTELNLEEE